MAGQNKVQLLVELIGKDGITKLLDSAATEALRLERNMKRGQKAGNTLAKSVSKIGSNWAMVVTGLNQGLELFDKMTSAAQAVTQHVAETARMRQVEARFTQQLNVSLEQLSQAAGFQLSDLELQKFALQAQQAGVSMQQFQKLLDVSLRASAATGKDFGAVFEGLFVDTVVGATDSFLEQIGVVADMGTITEAYAKKMGIAKDAIDKTHQSQAMLNHVLTEVSGKFDGVTVDGFTTEISRAQRQLEEFQREVSIGLMMVARDTLEYFGIIEERGPSALQKLRSQMDELELQQLRVARHSMKMLDGSRQLSKHAEQGFLQMMRRIGETARRSDDAMTILFDRIRREASALTDVTAGFVSSEQQAELYDQALMKLAEQYGVLDIAESRYGQAARRRLDLMRYQTQEADRLSNAYSGLAFQIGRVEKVSDLERVMGQDESQYFQTAAQRLGLEKIVAQKPTRRRGGARKKEPSESEINKRFEALRRGYERTTKAQQKYLPVAMTLREEMEALEAEASLGLTDAFGGEDRFQWMDSTEIRMVKLAEAMQSIASAANAMDAAVQQLGTSPGFANAIKQVGSMTEAGLKFADTNDKTTDSYANLTGAIITGSGQAALGFVEGERERAAIMAVMETANAGVMFAKFAASAGAAPHLAVAGAMHLANAAMFGAIAGGAGGGGGGGMRGGAGGGGRMPSGVRDIPRFGQQQVGQEMQPAQVVVNMSGAIVAGANRKKTANDLGALVQESMGARR